MASTASTNSILDFQSVCESQALKNTAQNDAFLLPGSGFVHQPMDPPALGFKDYSHSFVGAQASYVGDGYRSTAGV